jgi:hypothetical protein
MLCTMVDVAVMATIVHTEMPIANAKQMRVMYPVWRSPGRSIAKNGNVTMR